ncbi:hypothetical protein G7Y89_g1038 [Cudoniella acicularis]|uniref:FAD-binding domain-containing protein n=1 Tax=Cudoniella acicularis TaxID=354080 RepID=A0A8H4RW19_9HELO|nr:hypothetical protein G7Y89_g1038 [Cudoniella acicularis]
MGQGKYFASRGTFGRYLVDIQVRAKVVDYDAVHGKVVVADSRVLQADLIVAADGVHSAAPTTLDLASTALLQSGPYRAFRDYKTMRLIIAASDAHGQASFKEQFAPGIFAALKSSKYQSDRYNISNHHLRIGTSNDIIKETQVHPQYPNSWFLPFGVDETCYTSTKSLRLSWKASVVRWRGTLVAVFTQHPGPAGAWGYVRYGQDEIALSCLSRLTERLEDDLANLPQPDSTQESIKRNPLVASVDYTATFWAQYLEGAKRAMLIQNTLTEQGEVGTSLRTKLE